MCSVLGSRITWVQVIIDIPPFILYTNHDSKIRRCALTPHTTKTDRDGIKRTQGGARGERAAGGLNGAGRPSSAGMRAGAGDCQGVEAPRPLKHMQKRA